MPAIWMPHTLPACVAYGIECMPWWRTEIVTMQDGREDPNITWAQSRHEYDLEFVTSSNSDYLAAKSHFNMARGKGKKWPFKDPADFNVPQSLGVIVETEEGYRVAKRYGTGSDAYDRLITRPVSPVLYEGSSVAVGMTIDPDTGILEGVDSDGIDPLDFSWECDLFWVPVRYDVDKFPTKITNRIGAEFFIQVSGLPLVEAKE